MIKFTFRRSRSTWFVETNFSGALSTIGTENASETRFQTLKVDHANALIDALSLVKVANSCQQQLMQTEIN